MTKILNNIIVKQEKKKKKMCRVNTYVERTKEKIKDMFGSQSPIPFLAKFI